MLQWTWGYKSLFKIAFLLPLNMKRGDGWISSIINFGGNLHTVFIMAGPIYIQANSAWMSPFLLILMYVSCFFLINNSCSNSCEGVPLSGLICSASLSVCWHLHVFLGQMSFQDLCPFFTWLVCIITTDLYVFFIYFGY